jgi:lysozyme
MHEREMTYPLRKDRPMALPPGASPRDRWLELADEARAKTQEALANGNRHMAGLWDEHERTMLRNAYDDVPFRDAAVPLAGGPKPGFDPAAALPARGIQVASASNDPPTIGDQTAPFIDDPFVSNEYLNKPKALDAATRKAIKDRPAPDAAVNLIKTEEKFAPEVYDDQGKNPTIGYGHKLSESEMKLYPKGKFIDEAKGHELLRGDLADAVDAVKRNVKVPLSDNEYSALVSFAYNAGAGALAGSTLLKKLNAGDYAGAAAEFPKWIWVTDKATGEKSVSNGLITRREKEQKLFKAP